MHLFSTPVRTDNNGRTIISTQRDGRASVLPDTEPAEGLISQVSHNAAELARLTDEHRDRITPTSKTRSLVPYLAKRNEIWSKGFLADGRNSLASLVPELLSAFCQKATSLSGNAYRSLQDRSSTFLSNLIKVHDFQGPGRFDPEYVEKYYPGTSHPLDNSFMRSPAARPNSFKDSEYTQMPHKASERPSIKDFIFQLRSGLGRIKSLIDPMHAQLDKALGNSILEAA